MAGARVTSSPVRRLLRLGGLVTRVGASVAGQQLASLARGVDGRERARRDNLVKNAARIVETLGEMKGAAMKVGQMLSLHDSILPPEVAEVLRALQKEAPRIPFEVVQEELALALPAWRRLFREVEPEAFAAASIGQVHRAVLRDGRRVAVKVQYPLIDRIVAADLGNLKRLLQAVFALLTEADFEPVWRELSVRLGEELDYLHEAENARQMAELHRDVPEIVIPQVVREATTRRVLTMEYVPGIPPDEACSDRHPQELKDRWGEVLLAFLLRGLLAHRLLHADPNLANFAFRADGAIVVYDFGCLKKVPPAIARGYRESARAIVEGRLEDLPAVLQAMGVTRGNGEPVALLPLLSVAAGVAEVFRAAPPFCFADAAAIYGRIFDLGSDHFDAAADLRFPPHVIFVDRTIAGHFGNLSRLGATGDWRRILLSHLGRPRP
jgi:predicted unusual protein kinase regulating ubiquinone biosynthesis (AarF/ABC1/UbiB family)